MVTAVLVGTAISQFAAERPPVVPVLRLLAARPDPHPGAPVNSIPEAALARLADPAAKSGFYTSDLSVSEFLLVKEAGFHPLGLVMGTSIYHVGLQGRSWSQNQELTVLTQALYQAREAAMGRMVAEAEALGADGIVGVRLQLHARGFSESVTEFLAVGTAVKAEGARAAQQWRTAANEPFTSDLSGQDFWTLLQTGHAPLGLVLGTCVYHLAPSLLGGITKSGQNVELVAPTQGFYEARELAMARMQAEGEALGAEGVVGVRMETLQHTWGPHTTEFLAIGTAVKPYAADHLITTPTMTVTLA